MDAFVDVHGKIPRPVLRLIIGAWAATAASSGPIRFIVSGTRFSFDLLKKVLSSGVGKDTDRPAWTQVRQMGDCVNRSRQESYISRHLLPTFLSSPSSTALVSRMFEWLRGR